MFTLKHDDEAIQRIHSIVVFNFERIYCANGITRLLCVIQMHLDDDDDDDDER